MDYKEKLRLAKEALDSGSYDKETIEYIFPELAKSEDKRVRIKLIEFFKGYYPDKEWWGNITQRDILTWLEKYGEKAKYHDICDKCVRQPTCQSDCFLQQGEQKSFWSEEDKMQLDAAIHLVSSTGHIETANWLKSIKDRVLQQNITVTDEELAKAKKDAYNDALDKIEYHSGEPTFDDGWSAAIWYLKKKNARPQFTWKPSDEQFKLLKHIMENVPLSYIDKSEVGGLYLDLKRLIRE